MAEKFNRATFTRNFLKNITRIKAPDEMLAEAKAQGLEKTLGVIDLIVLGVGAIIGSGIFAVVGIAAAGSADGSSLGAGPALVVSMIIAAIACIFSASESKSDLEMTIMIGVLESLVLSKKFS